jgi:hypothetical protein
LRLIEGFSDYIIAGWVENEKKQFNDNTYHLDHHVIIDSTSLRNSGILTEIYEKLKSFRERKELGDKKESWIELSNDNKVIFRKNDLETGSILIPITLLITLKVNVTLSSEYFWKKDELNLIKKRDENHGITSSPKS